MPIGGGKGGEKAEKRGVDKRIELMRASVYWLWLLASGRPGPTTGGAEEALNRHLSPARSRSTRLTLCTPVCVRMCVIFFKRKFSEERTIDAGIYCIG